MTYEIERTSDAPSAEPLDIAVGAAAELSAEQLDMAVGGHIVLSSGYELKMAKKV